MLTSTLPDGSSFFCSPAEADAEVEAVPVCAAAFVGVAFTGAVDGRTLLAAEDPTGIGGVLAGFGDQREVELLVEAGFTPLEAIRIATFNGAQYLGEADTIGSIAAGKRADLVVTKGDPSKKIEDIENVEIVFKDGIGYDSAKLIESVRGVAGSR